MKAIRIEHHGGPEVMPLDDVRLAEPSQGEALVDVRAAGVNFMDIGMQIGRAHV